MLLAGDIGGTKTNLALYSPELGLTPKAQTVFRSSDYPALEAVVARFLADTGAVVDRAVFGVAGPVVRGRISVTNLPWVISETAMETALDLPAGSVHLLNDLEATAHGALHLPATDLEPLNDIAPREGTKAVLAAGTGLGEAVMFYHEGRHYVIPSEGGHTDFGPTNSFEMDLLYYLMDKFGHVSYERVCSGIGLPNIYAYLKERSSGKESPEMAEVLHKAADPTPIIVQKAMAGECDLCLAALNAFVSILGAEAGNLGLKVMAIGGIYIGGGIPPRILPKLKEGSCMAAFVNKGRFAKMLSQIPVVVILNREAALVGAASYGLGL